MRVSLLVALYVEFLDVVLGAPLGLAAGYRGGKVDFVITRVADVLFAFPGLLLAILVATVAALVLSYEVKTVLMPDNLTSAITLPTIGAFSRLFETPVLVMTFTVAFVASAETLLCATAVDQLHSGQRTKYDKELWAQGVGNVLCGLVGALPMTAVIVRSAANVQAGARTRASRVLHGVWLLLFVVLLPGLLTLIPVAVLAAVLVHAGWKLLGGKQVITGRGRDNDGPYNFQLTKQH